MPHKTHFPLALLYLLLLLLPAACGTPSNAPKESEAGQDAPASRLAPEEQARFNELYLAAMCERDKENYSAMHELLSRALDIDPDAPEALFDMSLLKFSMASMLDSLPTHEGDSLLRRCVQLAPRNTYYKTMLANYLTQTGEMEEAIRLYEELAEQKPNSSDVMETLVRLYENTGNYTAAVKTLERLETLEGTDEAYTIEKFKNYLSMEDTTQAMSIIHGLCADNPDDQRFRVLLASTYYSNDRREEAFAVLDSVLRKEPHNPYALTTYINIYAAESPDSLYPQAVRNFVLDEQVESNFRTQVLGDFVRGNMDEGSDSMGIFHLFADAMALPSADAQMADLCVAYFSIMKFPYATIAPIMENVLRVQPDNIWARSVLMQQASARNDRQRIISLCREGQIYTPNSLPFYYYEAVELYMDDKKQEALEAVQRGETHIDEQSNATAATYIYDLLGDLLHEAGRADEAFAAYDKSLALDSNNAPCLNNYAYFLSLENRELERAESMSRRTIELEPENATYLDTYAWILYQQKKYRQALIYIEQTLLHADEEDLSAIVLEHAGDIYFRCGQSAKALKYWKKALQEAEEPADIRRLKLKTQRKRI